MARHGLETTSQALWDQLEAAATVLQPRELRLAEQVGPGLLLGGRLIAPRHSGEVPVSEHLAAACRHPDPAGAVGG